MKKNILLTTLIILFGTGTATKAIFDKKKVKIKVVNEIEEPTNIILCSDHEWSNPGKTKTISLNSGKSHIFKESAGSDFYVLWEETDRLAKNIYSTKMTHLPSHILIRLKKGGRYDIESDFRPLTWNSAKKSPNERATKKQDYEIEEVADEKVGELKKLKKR